jgi:hypothetical protein
MPGEISPASLNINSEIDEQEPTERTEAEPVVCGGLEFFSTDQ